MLSFIPICAESEAVGMVITMKKLRSLALALCLGLALPAAAADAAAVDAPSAVSVGSVTAAVRADGSL